MRKTKIICTIGPASQSEEKLKELMLAGMNVARFNFSHGDHEEQTGKFANVLKVSQELNLPIATLLDTKGPEIRIRDFENDDSIALEAGQTFILTTDDVIGTNKIVSVTYKNMCKDVRVGSHVLIDDGLIDLLVEEIEGNNIICKVLNAGYISNKKGVNVPGVSLTMPYISKKDRDDIILGAKLGFDFIAASFARNKEDIIEVREILNQYKSKAKIIAKIENLQGVENLDEILEVSDGIMVARGDMGVEIPMEDVPPLQKKMIKRAVEEGKHVITATQMLDSMMKNPRPTRAEATDVANAIYDGTSAIMLSGETANGMYPVEALKTMARIAERTEKDIDYVSRLKKATAKAEIDITTAICHATCTVANNVSAKAIITVTMSGFTADMIARFRPSCAVVGCSVNPRVCRQMNLLWGVMPCLMKKKQTENELFDEAVEIALETGIVQKGDKVVITAGVPLAITGRTNMIRVVEV